MRRRGCDSQRNLDLAAHVRSLWKNRLKTTHGQGELFEGLHKKVEHGGPPRLRWIVCWQMELCERFPEVMALA